MGGQGLLTDPSPVKVRWIASNTVMIDMIRLHNPLQKPCGPTQEGTLIFDQDATQHILEGTGKIYPADQGASKEAPSTPRQQCRTDCFRNSQLQTAKLGFEDILKTGRIYWHTIFVWICL